MTNRWWVYQQERFPLLAHGPLVVIFCLSVLSFSSLQRGDELPQLAQLLSAVVSTLILFFQLRVADEFKDFTIDSKFRPHRPVPRGLVSLRELARLAWAGAAIQFCIALYNDIGLIPVLVAVWAYMGLMTREFFVKSWLVDHPTVYLVSHMLVMPLIAFYVSTFDWLCDSGVAPPGLAWLLGLSFCSGLVLELGRKIKIPAAERTGVETYSGLWGVGTAVALWTAAAVASVAAFTMAASYLGHALAGITVAFVVLLLAIVTALLFPRKANTEIGGNEKFIEPSSGLIALALYFALGPLQALLA